MTVTSETVRVAYAGNGATTAFSTSFIFSDNDHVVVTLISSAGVGTTWVEGTQYTLTGAGTGAAGTLTVDTSPTDYTPQTGETLVIVRDVPHTQETDFPTGGSFPSASVETALDLAAMRSAKNAFDIGRTLHAPDTDSSSLDMELPTETARASKYLFFDADGEPTAVADVNPGNVSISAFAETLLDDASAATARTTLGLGTAATQATGTSGAAVPLLNANATFSENLTVSGSGTALTANTLLNAAEDVRISGDISPSQITSSQNNYNPTGLADATVLRLTSDATRSVTGLAGGADGRIIIIANRGSNSIDLTASDASSDADKQFDVGASLGLETDHAGIFWYDSTDSKWICVGKYMTPASQTSMEAAGTTRSFVSPSRQHFHPGHPKFWEMATVSGAVPTSQASYNLTSIADTATGQLTCTIATDFSSANWKADLQTEMTSTTLTEAGGNINHPFIAFGGIAAGTIQVDAADFTATTHVRRDPTSWHVGGSGDQS